MSKEVQGSNAPGEQVELWEGRFASYGELETRDGKAPPNPPKILSFSI